MHHTINNEQPKINWSRGGQIDRHGLYTYYEMTGTCDGVKYEGVGEYLCGGLVEVMEVERV